MKKIISLIMTVAVTASLAVGIETTASAAVSRESGIIALLDDLEIMQGDENGDLMLDKEVSRAEFAKIAIAASSAKNTVAVGLKISPYRDVPYTKWYAPYIKAAVSAGYVEGYLDSTYRPDNAVTYEEAVTIMLRILGYDDSSFGSAYPYGQLAQAQGLEMLDDVNATMGESMTRRQVMYLVYNTLQCSSAGNSSASASGSQAASGAVTTTASAAAVASASFSGTLISTHDCTMTEDIDIISTSAEDSSLGADKVFTSAGTYTKGKNFSDESVGMTGTVFIKNNKDIIAFVPDEDYNARDYETYLVYSTLSNSVIGYNNGSLEEINIPDSTKVYRNQSVTTYQAIKNTLEMGDTLYVKRTNGGSVDYITYETGTLEGPVKVTTSNWLSNVGGNSSTTIMRDGVQTTASAILVNDIVYYSAAINRVFAYSNKVTGVYESASPTKDSPTSVTISGTTYNLEGVDAFNNLSSNGSFNYGDTVTICIGKGGGAAGVVTSASVTSNNSAVTGYITDSGKRTFTNSEGKQYSSYYVTVVSTDGASGTYETKYDNSTYVGCTCTLTFSGNTATVSKIKNTSNLSGAVSYKDGTIGGEKVASGVNILDVVNDSNYDVVLYKKIYMQRIDGITLNASDVLYYAKNISGEITDIILKNVTNDAYTYGVVNSNNGSVMSIDVNGSVSNYTPTGNISDTGRAVKLVMSGGKLLFAEPLSVYSSSVSALTATTATINGTSYKLADNVVIYKKTASDSYQKITLEEAQSGNYSINAYYDKSEAKGGRIRIIVCNY